MQEDHKKGAVWLGLVLFSQGFRQQLTGKDSSWCCPNKKPSICWTVFLKDKLCIQCPLRATFSDILSEMCSLSSINQPGAPGMCMCCLSPSPSVPQGGPPPQGFHQKGGCVCFRRHKSTKRGGPFLNPRFDPFPRGEPVTGFCLRCRLRLRVSGAAALHPSRMSPLTRRQIGIECT